VDVGKPRPVGHTVAIAASAAFHVAVLALLVLHAPRLKTPPAEPGGPPIPIIPLLLAPRALPDDAEGERGGAIRLHRRQVRARDLPSHVRPLIAAAQAEPVAPAAPVETARVAAGPAAPAADPAGGLALARTLRGRLGCANPETLSAAERTACEERLGRGAPQAPYMPAPIERTKRSYYDAVAEAKAPSPPPTPGTATGKLGMFDSDLRGTKGHGPQIGCSVKFGPGAKTKGPPNALKLGPCFINPPAGSLTPDVDIPPP
jgi:hypothetical protein